MTASKKPRSNAPDGMASRREGAEKAMPAFLDLRIARRYLESPERIDISRAKGISESAVRWLKV